VKNDEGSSANRLDIEMTMEGMGLVLPLNGRMHVL
jgi:hypothetical protein